jgi:hypothetical protein
VVSSVWSYGALSWVRTRHGRADLPDLQSWAGRVLADQEGVGMTRLAAEVRPMISAASGTLATARTRLANMGLVFLLTVGSSGLVKPGSVSGWCSGQRPTCPIASRGRAKAERHKHARLSVFSPSAIDFVLIEVAFPWHIIPLRARLFYDASRPGGSYRFCNLRKLLAPGGSRRADMPAARGHRVSGTAEARLKKTSCLAVNRPAGGRRTRRACDRNSASA